jgi:ankyrin repeat protein
MTSTLWDAVRDNKIPLVRALLHKGADVNQRNARGETVLFDAVKNGNLPLVDILINYGAETDVNAVNNDGISILIIGIQRNRIEIVRRLLNAGVDFEIGIKNPLEEAVYNGYAEMTNLLIEWGLDPFYMNANKETLLHTVSAKARHWEDSNYEYTLELLLNYEDPYGRKLDINRIDCMGDTPLSIAITNDHVDMVKILLDHGADPNLVYYENLIISPEIQDLLDYNDPDIKEPEH